MEILNKNSSSNNYNFIKLPQRHLRYLRNSLPKIMFVINVCDVSPLIRFLNNLLKGFPTHSLHYLIRKKTST